MDKEVARFLDHVEESHLGEVVHIPLLATIAVAMQTTSPERPLPTTQVELYERFVAELLDARPPTTGAKADWREWLHVSRAALLSHLARLHLDGEAALLPASRRWVEQQQPANLGAPRDSERCVEQALVDSGLVTFTDGALRFIHQSVVEYLAARHYADLAGTSFEPMQRWSAQVTERATSSNLALFTLAIWSRNEANDGGLVIRRLLADRSGAMEAVVQLITVGARLDPDLKKAVVDGLIESFHDLRFGDKWVDLITRVRGLPTLAHRIEELVNSKTISFDDRVEAAAAFAWAIDRSRGVDMLLALIPSATPANRLKVCNELFDLDHDRGSLTDLARSIISDPKASRMTQVNAAYTLASCGETEGLTELVTKVAASSENTDHEFVSAAVFLLEHLGRQHVRLIMDLLRAHQHIQQWQLGDLAEALQKVDAHEEVVELAREVIDNPNAEGDDELINKMVRTWSLSAVRHGSALDIANAIRSASHLSYMTRCSMAVELHRAGLSTEAANLLREFLPVAARKDGRYIHRLAYETLLEIDNATHLEHIVETASDWVLVGLSKLIDLLVKAGDAEFVVDAARRLLADPVTPREGRLEAIKGWLHADRRTAATALSIVRQLQPAASERLQHAQLMGHYGADDEARALALDVLADPVAVKEHMLEAMKIVLRTGSRDETAAAIATLRANQRCTGQEKAWVAAELSTTDRDMLSDLWLDVVVGSDVSLERRIRAAEELRSAGAQARGRAAIDAARLSSGLTNVQADRLNRLKGWLDTA